MHETIRMLGLEKERELVAEAERLHRGAIAKSHRGPRFRALWIVRAVRRALAARPVRASEELGPEQPRT